MKKILSILIFWFFSIISFWFQNDIIYANENTNATENIDVNLEKVFIYFWEILIWNSAQDYESIELNIKNLDKNSKIYTSLQKMVSLGIIKNLDINIDFNSKIKVSTFNDYVLKITWINISKKFGDLNKFVTKNDVISSYKFIKDYKTKIITEESEKQTELDKKVEEKFQIFQDVYNTILQDFYNKNNVDKVDLLNQAIIWLTKWSKDQFTTYFPPAENTDFFNSLEWTFEWIWAYVDMETAWILKIVSPISGSPAEKAWIFAWDIVFQVDDTKITDKITLNQAVSLIKWETWTKVKLSILRWDKVLNFEVTRAKIELKDVETKVIDNKFFYIKIRMFWDKVFQEFRDSLTEAKKQTWVKKIIIDLRNNPGWYLDAVTKMLSLFIEKDKPVAVVKYIDSELSYWSVGYEKIINLWDYQVYILSNWWTASASEIMIWTLKDYFPSIKVIWEKTYWKWSVQTIKEYRDWSSLKYTIALWFTWLTKTWINWVWINPDIEVKFDENENKKWNDNQLDYILKNY